MKKKTILKLFKQKKLNDILPPQGYVSALAAAAVFGFLAMLVYGVDAGFKFKGWRAGELAQGERKVTVEQRSGS